MHREATTVAFGDPRLPERFWAKVEVREDGCWQWTAALKDGYGVFRSSPQGMTSVAHRFGYMTLIGDPGELTLDHLCRNRACVNPAHLEPVTQRENCLRGESPAAHHARQTHCIRGHALSGANVYSSPSRPNARLCRTCRELELGRRSTVVLGVHVSPETREALHRLASERGNTLSGEVRFAIERHLVASGVSPRRSVEDRGSRRDA